MMIFNNATGTAEQKMCQNTCGIYDKGTGNSERKDRNGEPFDVKYKIQEDGKFSLVNFADKCVTCSHWNAFRKKHE